MSTTFLLIFNEIVEPNTGLSRVQGSETMYICIWLYSSTADTIATQLSIQSYCYSP
jgi:hypothetical protein